MDYSPWGHKELDTTEWLSLLLHFPHANHEPLEGRVSVSSTIEAHKHFFEGVDADGRGGRGLEPDSAEVIYLHPPLNHLF